MNKKNFIIGGPARNGKTTLAEILYQKGKHVIGLPVESLFHVFYSRVYPVKSLQRRIILEEWLCQARCRDEKRVAFAKPMDFFLADFETILRRLPRRCNHPLQIFEFVLSFFASENQCISWAVHDIHSESLYGEYRRHIPSLNLVVMLRDPRESVCASLYWRCYPERNSLPKGLLEYRLMMWVFSVETYLLWKSAFPENVTMLNFNGLVRKNRSECEKLSNEFGVSTDSFSDRFKGGIPDFSFVDGRFKTPEGKSKKLMGEDELCLVEGITGKYFKKFGWENQPRLVADGKNKKEIEMFERKVRRMLEVLERSPRAAKDFIDRNMEYSRKNLQRKRKTYWTREVRRNVRNLVKIALCLGGDCGRMKSENDLVVGSDLRRVDGV